MIKFSVIIPAYNVEKYIEKCLNSVIKQSYSNFEIILINDGSTDNTLSIVKEKYQNQKIQIVDKKNSGLSDSRNIGVTKSSGDYIIFLDPDDWWEKDLLQKLNDNLSINEVDIIAFKLQKYYEKTITFSSVNIPSFNKVNGIEALNRFISSHVTFETAVTFAYRKKYWQDNNFKFKKNTLHEDFGLVPYVIAMAKEVISINYVGYNYLQRENSITKNNDYNNLYKKANDTLIHFLFLKEEIWKLNIDNYSKNLIANYLMNAIITKIKLLKDEDQKHFYLILKKEKVHRLFKSYSIKTFIKKFLLWINPKNYLYFVK